MNAKALWDASFNLSDPEKWEIINQRVDVLLNLAAWSQLPSAILTAVEKQAWESYIAALQDLQVTYPNPEDVVFPEAPGSPINQSTQAFRVARERRVNARAQALAIPDWAAWSEADVLTWLQANIGTPLNTPIPANPMTVQQIRAVLVNIVAVMNSMYTAERAMARMVVAIRDDTWPNLADE